MIAYNSLSSDNLIAKLFRLYLIRDYSHIFILPVSTDRSFVKMLVINNSFIPIIDN